MRYLKRLSHMMNSCFLTVFALDDMLALTRYLKRLSHEMNSCFLTAFTRDGMLALPWSGTVLVTDDDFCIH
jgi:hypothetical protein